MKIPIIVGAAVAAAGLAVVGATAIQHEPAAYDTTTTTVSTDPPDAPGATVQASDWVLTYTVTDPTGAQPPATESIGVGKRQCSHLYAELDAQIGDPTSSVAPTGMIVTSVNKCVPDGSSFTTDTTTTTVAP